MKTEEGHVLRRNRRDLLKTKDTLEDEHCGDEDDVSPAETGPDMKIDGTEKEEK